MRHLPLFALFCVLLTGCGPEQPPANSIMVLQPYWMAGTWVFDDAKFGLKGEPFIEGAPEIIEDMSKGIPDAYKGFRLLFSAGPFPGYTHSLTWQKGDRSGNWYVCDQTKQLAWLCPALFKYFSKAPGKLYAKAEALKSP